MFHRSERGNPSPPTGRRPLVRTLWDRVDVWKAVNRDDLFSVTSLKHYPYVAIAQRSMVGDVRTP